MIGHAMAVTVVAVGSAMGGVAASGGSPVVLPTSPIAAVGEAPTPAPGAAEPARAPDRAEPKGAPRAEQPVAAPAGGTTLPTGTSVGSPLDPNPQLGQRADDGPSGADSDDGATLGTDPRNVARETAETVDHYVGWFRGDDE
jgi:hypothetical protein